MYIANSWDKNGIGLQLHFGRVFQNSVTYFHAIVPKYEIVIGLTPSVKHLPTPTDVTVYNCRLHNPYVATYTYIELASYMHILQVQLSNQLLRRFVSIYILEEISDYIY